MKMLLVIDDDNQVVELFRYLFPRQQYGLRSASSAAEALAQLKRIRFDTVVASILLPDSTGFEFFQRLREFDQVTQVILTGTGGHSAAAIASMRQGVFRFLVKPLNIDEVRVGVERSIQITRLSRLHSAVPGLAPGETNDNEHLIGDGPAMQAVYRQIGRVAGSDATVLITGERGAGKEIVARAIYRHSKRANLPYLSIDCTSRSESLFECDLFGSEGTSGTGEHVTHPGKFELYDGGTVFLDEVGDMTLLMQAKFLRLLQDQLMERVGGTESLRSNVRVIAATSRDLNKMMQQGTFRSDLYYRLSTYTIRIPPLRERLCDLPLLIDNFVLRYSLELQKHIHSVSPQAVRLLGEYSWPGNVRELQNTLKNAMIEATGPVILADYVPESIRVAISNYQMQNADSNCELRLETDQLEQFIRKRIALGTEHLYDDILNSLEGQILTVLLGVLQGDLQRSALTLGTSYSALRMKMANFGINMERSSRNSE